MEPEPLWGILRIHGYSQVFASVFPRAEHVIERVLGIDGSVPVQSTWIATQTGPPMTPRGQVPPTGRTMSTLFHMGCRVRGGRGPAAV